MDHLAGRVAVVTGAGSGIGRATAVALATDGVNIIVADLVASRTLETADLVRATGVQARALTCDVAEDETFEELLRIAQKDFGRCDIVMNNAAVISSGLPEEIPISEWHRVLSVNLTSIGRSIRVFLPGMVARGEGHIVNTASLAGLFSYAFDRLPYSASKAAVIGLSEALALYCRPRGVGVTCLCPGPVATNIGKSVSTWSPNQTRRGPGPSFSKLESGEVGRMVVDAIKSNRFFLPTHPNVRELLVRRAEDMDAFLDEQIASFASW